MVPFGTIIYRFPVLIDYYWHDTPADTSKGKPYTSYNSNRSKRENRKKYGTKWYQLQLWWYFLIPLVPRYSKKFMKALIWQFWKVLNTFSRLFKRKKMLGHLGRTISLFWHSVSVVLVVVLDLFVRLLLNCKSMQKHAKACKSMQKQQKQAKAGKSRQKQTKAGMQKRAKACKSMQKHAKACKSMQKHHQTSIFVTTHLIPFWTNYIGTPKPSTKACKSMQKHAKACKSTINLRFSWLLT